MITYPARDMSNGKMVGIEADDKKVLLAMVNGHYYAIRNVCTHMACTLSDGTLTGDHVQCPCHGSTFDVKTGVLIRGPARLPETAYPVRTEGENIIIDA